MVACLASTCLTNACSSYSSRMDSISQTLENSHYEARILPTAPFPLYTAEPRMSAPSFPNGGISTVHADSPLTVVIEGDGFAWLNRNTVSDNPTPKNAVGLAIATHLYAGTPKAGRALYLARPCQYVWASDCRPYYWTTGRFDDSVLRAMNDALDRMMAAQPPAKAKQLHLIGYSGGAYIALLLAARRTDIAAVTTISGVLDPQAWTEFHDVSPLRLAQNPEELLMKTQTARFTHFCGDEDAVAPCSLTQDFVVRARRMGLHNHAMIRVSGDHETAWHAAISHLTH